MDVAGEQFRAEMFQSTKIKENVREKVYSFGYYLMDKIKGESEVKMPTLKHNVHFEEGHLKFEPLEIKGGSFNQKTSVNDLNKSFEGLVGLWLFENGYSPTQGGGFSHPTTGVLTEAHFNTLNDPSNPNNLDAFLEKVGREKGLTYESVRPTV
jgi:hypothetical protein